jgi:general secretion pathway protein F
MGLFLYKAIDSKGKKTTGRIQAGSYNEAKKDLLSQGISLIKLRPLSVFSDFFKKKQVDLKPGQRILLTTQLAQLLNAGLPIYESLISLEEQYKGENFHAILTHLTTQIREGKTLSEALSRYPKSFSSLYISMVLAGEQVGLLAQTLEKLAHLLQKQEKLKKQLTTALLYPAILSFFSFGLVLLLLIYVVPSLETLFEGRELHPFTATVFAFSHFFRSYWLVLLGAIAGLTTGLTFLMRQPKWKRAWHQTLLSLPGIKKLIIKASIARFCRTMGTLLEGGVTIIKALQTARAVMGQPILEEVIEEAEKKIIEGSLLSKELARSPYIPTLVTRLIAVSEESGQSAVMHQKIADLYEEDVEKILTRLTTLAQPVILLVIGCIVGFIMLAILLPLTDVSSFIN